MPAISTRFPATRTSYLPSTSDTSYRKSIYTSSSTSSTNGIGGDSLLRRSSLISSCRHYGDDTSSASSRFGVSTRCTTSSSTSTPLSSQLTRASIDRELRSKPPIGSRMRSESRYRDLSLDSGYTSSPSSLNNTKRLSTSSFARSVATSGADLYEKYGVSTYKPKCELSRSRSLTDSTANKLVDSISANSHSGSGSSIRTASKDRTSSGSLLAGNISTKDYLNNHRRSPSPSTSVSIKVKSSANFSVLTSSLANSRCLLSSSNNSNNNNNNNNTVNGVNAATAINNNNNSIRSLSKSVANNNNNNICSLSDSIVVTAITNHTDKINSGKKLNVVAAGTAHNSSKFGVARKLPPTCSVSNSILNGLGSAVASTSSVDPAKVAGKTKADHLGANTTTTTSNTRPISSYSTANGTAYSDLKSNDLFKRRLGTNPLSPYKNPDFLKCEYDLARSQVIVSQPKSIITSETNNNSPNSPAKESNLNKITISSVNSVKSITPPPPPHTPEKSAREATSHTNALGIDSVDCATLENMNCVQNNIDLLDDIKFIDSDDSERKNSPNLIKSTKEFFKDTMPHTKNMSTSTLPSIGTAKKFHDIYTNKYNTITNGTSSHQINIQIGNEIAGVARKAVAEDMMSSTSSSTSTLSAMTESSTSSSLPGKEIASSAKLNNQLDGSGDNVSELLHDS